MTFKEKGREQQIYDWLQTKLSKGAFIKDLLASAMDAELGEVPVQQVAETKRDHVSPPQSQVQTTAPKKKQRGMGTLKSF